MLGKQSTEGRQHTEQMTSMPLLRVCPQAVAVATGRSTTCYCNREANEGHSQVPMDDALGMDVG